MVNGSSWFRLVALVTLLALADVSAKDLAAYKLGDKAEADITAPVALDVIDAEATATRKVAEALKTPAIFRSYPNPTNAMVREFTGEFAKERAIFAASLKTAFGEITNADETLALPAFKRFLTTFNRKPLAFPVSTELAGVWARGDSGEAIQTTLVNALLQMTHRPIRPNDSTNSPPLGETVRLVVVDSPNEYLNLADAEQRGKLVTLTSVTTVDRLRDLFRRQFPREDLAFARAVGKFLRPNCELDASLTQQARDHDVSQLVALSHYDAGQVIAKRGEVIHAKMLAALTQLNDKLPSAPVVQKPAVPTATPRAPLAIGSGYIDWMTVALIGVSAVALAGYLILHRARRRDSIAPVLRAEKFPPEFPASLSPQITQVLKDAVVQGLAAQRSELLQAQQAAANEISELVHRLDELKAPMQERLNSYQSRITELERELADQSKENRELLKAKIEMLREKIEGERSVNRTNFN